MIARFASILILASVIAAPAGAQLGAPAPATSVASPPAEAPKYRTVRVSLQTDAGPIVLELEEERAPATVANFLRYVDKKRLDGTSFYRATRIAPGYGLIQGGARNDPKRLFPPVAHEPTSKTGLTHADGTISMARANPGSATGDFFITIGTMPVMDADPAKPGDNVGYAAFGRVVEGMDVVRKILEAPTSPTEGEGVMKGQMLAPKITIVQARRTNPVR
jgi:peptidyl-prolyl cis-trans isomerase A (cyclophilin A)